VPAPRLHLEQQVGLTTVSNTRPSPSASPPAIVVPGKFLFFPYFDKLITLLLLHACVNYSRTGTMLLLVEFCQLSIMWGRRKQGHLIATKREKKHTCDLILKDGGRGTTTGRKHQAFFLLIFLWGGCTQ
jgi:hypothetical protein